MCCKIRRVFFHKAICLLTGIVAWSGSGTAFALPPLGFTLIESGDQPFNGLAIDLSVIDGEAYVSTNTEVWQIDSANTVLTPIVHSRYGVPTGFNGLSRVVKAIDQQLYLTGNFTQLNSDTAGALFRLDSPSLEIVTWPTANYLVGVDHNLRSLGNDRNKYVAEFLIDGSINGLGLPPGGCQCQETQFLVDVAPSGFATGELNIPGTIGSGPGLWAPDGTASVLGIGIGGGRIADRHMDDGLNIAVSADGGEYRFKLGFLDISLNEDAKGNPLPGVGSAIVSQTALVVIQNFLLDQYFAYYPGIVEGSPQAARDLFEVFPELATIDINRITDIYTTDNRVYMTVYGDDGLFLFGAPDPSVVPEPTTLVLLLVASACFISRRRKSQPDCII